METVNYNPRDIYNMDESPFQVQYLSNTGQRMWTRRGSNQVSCKSGNKKKHATLIGCVIAAGVPLAPVLLWGKQKVRGEWFGHEKCPIHCRATGNGRSSADVFREWLFDVFLIQAKPNPTVMLFLDGSRTHLDVETLQGAKAKGIEIVCFPPPLFGRDPATRPRRVQTSQNRLLPTPENLHPGGENQQCPWAVH